MTNEELAVLAQAGDREALLKLWGQVRRMVLKYAHKWAASGRGGAEVEDLLQSGFIAMLRAVDSYDAAAGYAFTTHLFYLLKQEFTAACGQRTQRERLDPLQTAYSLDAPFTDDEGDPLTLADTLPDSAAEAELAAVADRDFEARRRAAIEEALSTLSADQQEAIRGRYYRNERVDVAAHAKALRLLRHPSRSRALMAYW